MITLAAEQRDRVLLIRVSGDLDARAAPQLRELCAAACAGGAHRIVLNLNHVTYIDSPGLAVIAGAQKRCRAHGGDLAVVCAADAVLEHLRACGLIGPLNVSGSFADAASAVTA